MYFDRENDIMSKLLDLPSAPQLLERVKVALDNEKIKRKQFYADIDDDMKAEFINGEIIIHSPVKKEHTDTTGSIYRLFHTFVLINELGYVGYEKVLSAFSRNDYEPDVVFFNAEKSKLFKKGMWKFPIPDLIVEVVSKSTEQRDRNVKYSDYEAHGVTEYWIVDADKETVEQYLLQNKKYNLHFKANKGIIESKAIKSFATDIRAFFDESICLQELKKMMAN
jgi:Uma2 family endonuclease